MRKTAFFIATGSELINFKVNQYAPLLSEKLKRHGIRLRGEITVGDDLEDIKKAILFAIGKGDDFIISCGGLGPTFDDLTRKAFAEVLGKKIKRSEKISVFLKKRYRLKILPPNIEDQCLILEGATLFQNDNGTAFGQSISFKGKTIILLPGPRNEWEPMWEKRVKKFLKNKNGNKEISGGFRFKIADLKEMETQKILSPVMEKHKNAEYTVLAGPNICEFYFCPEKYAEGSKIKREIEKLLGEKIYGTATETLEEKLGCLLIKKKKTLAAAESCTGGLLSNLITDIPGSSAYYPGGINAYSNRAKEKILGVRKETIKKYGAVSPECALEMAAGAKKIFAADYAVAVTGIAGPGGGTPEKPVGLVYFAVASPKRTSVFKKNFRGNRKFIKACAANFALFSALKIVKS